MQPAKRVPHCCPFPGPERAYVTRRSPAVTKKEIAFRSGGSLPLILLRVSFPPWICWPTLCSCFCWMRYWVEGIFPSTACSGVALPYQEGSIDGERTLSHPPEFPPRSAALSNFGLYKRMMPYLRNVRTSNRSLGACI